MTTITPEILGLFTDPNDANATVYGVNFDHGGLYGAPDGTNAGEWLTELVSQCSCDDAEIIGASIRECRGKKYLFVVTA